MIYSSLAVTAMAVSTLAASAASPIHLHPHQRVIDTRVSLVLHNTGHSFRDIIVNGQTYTLESHHDMTITAPAGTVVTMSSATPTYRRGQAIATLSSEQNHRVITLD